MDFRGSGNGEKDHADEYRLLQTGRRIPQGGRVLGHDRSDGPARGGPDHQTPRSMASPDLVGALADALARLLAVVLGRR